MKQKRFKNRQFLLICAASALVVAVILFLIFHHRASPTVTIPSTTPPASAKASSPYKQTPASSNASDASSGSTSDKSATSPASSSTTLIEPSGTFVSNHRPGQNNTGNGEQSVCNTTPGATCYILFTKDGETEKLDVQTTDPSGATYWTWDVKQAGFSAGSWQITAVVSLNGQVKTARDAIPLEVQP